MCIPKSRAVAVFAVASLALAAGACSQNRFPEPSWNLTGKDRAPPPPKPANADGARQAALPEPVQPPVPQYRGGRDPITGRAPSFGGPQQGFQAPPQQPAATPQRPTPDQRSEVAPAPAAAQAPVANRNGPRTIEVRPGQTLSLVASEYRISIAALMAANHLRDPYLIPGQTLIIPKP